MKIDKLDFTSKKKLIFTTPKNYPPLSLERSIVFTASMVIKIIFSDYFTAYYNNNAACILMISAHEQREVQKFHSKETQRDFHQTSRTPRA